MPDLDAFPGTRCFIVDRDGREIFLECNPAGQWLWLEDKLEFSVCDAMADELLIGF